MPFEAILAQVLHFLGPDKEKPRPIAEPGFVNF